MVEKYTHQMSQHTLEEMIIMLGSWEDPDSMLIVEHTEDNKFRITTTGLWDLRDDSPSYDTLYEALYERNHRCGCDDWLSYNLKIAGKTFGYMMYPGEVLDMIDEGIENG